ncbi:phospholipase D family protein [Bacteroidota bacterium]
MRILGTTEISYEIEKILRTAEKHLILVTPYLKLNQRLKVKLSDTFKKEFGVYIIHRKNELKPSDSNWLNSFENVRLFPIQNLHSKIYANEESLIISSMNLYEYSQINNHEIGVKLNSEQDEIEFKDTLNEIRIILESEFPVSFHKFDDIMESFEDYSMRSLYNKLNSNYKFKYNEPTLYEYICNMSREFAEFSNEELYQDKTAILRATQLGKKRFKLLENKLKTLAS